MSETLTIVSFGAGYILAGLALLGVTLKAAEPKQKLVMVRQRRK